MSILLFFLSAMSFAWILLCDVQEIYPLGDFLSSSFTKCHGSFHLIDFLNDDEE